MPCPLGVPLLPLYMRGAGLQERFPNRLRVGVLIGYNYISSCTRKIGSIPTPLEASWSFARRTVLMSSAGISSARPTLSGRVHFGQPRGYPGVIFPTGMLSQDTHEETQSALARTGWVGPTEYQRTPSGLFVAQKLQEASSGVGIDPIFLVQLEI